MLLWTFYCRWYGNWFEQMLKSDLKYFSVTRKYNSMWQSCISTLICRLFQKFGVNIFCGRQFMWVLKAIKGTKVVKWFVCFFFSRCCTWSLCVSAQCVFIGKTFVLLLYLVFDGFTSKKMRHTFFYDKCPTNLRSFCCWHPYCWSVDGKSVRGNK